MARVRGEEYRLIKLMLLPLGKSGSCSSAELMECRQAVYVRVCTRNMHMYCIHTCTYIPACVQAHS